MEKKVRLNKSGVSWTDYSWGIVDGCTKVSEACAHCYAEPMITRFQPDRKFTQIRTHPERLEAPLNTKKPGRVFVAPLGDLFHPDVPHEFIYKVIKMMLYTQHHTFQILTKRPERMYEFVKWYIMQTTEQLPDNIWLGVTAENQQRADERIPLLLQIPAAVRFVSVEPMLGPVDLHKYMWPVCWHWDAKYKTPQEAIAAGAFAEKHRQGLISAHAEFIDWVICGGESGSNARPMHPDWARSLRDQCIAAGVPFFFKQWGEWFPNDSRYTDSIPPNKDFYQYFDKKHIEFEDTFMCRVGAKNSGSILDGKEWKQMPEVA